MNGVRRRARASRRMALAIAVGAVALLGGGSPALADGTFYADPEQFELDFFTTETNDMQAGGFADVGTEFQFKNVVPEGRNPDNVVPYGRVKRLEVDLPPGLVGNPTAFPTCTLREFRSAAEACPPETQVGVADVIAQGMSPFFDRGVFNIERGPDDPVLLGVKVDISLYALLRVEVRPHGRLMAVVDEFPIGHPLIYNKLTLWGVPADHNGSGAPRVPFMMGPTECETIPTTVMRAFSYEGRASTATHSLASPLFGCDQLPFAPSMTATPTDRAAAAPTGLDVEIAVPQSGPARSSDEPMPLATAHVDQVQIKLPEGMKVSPSAANGLGACSPQEFGYDTVAEAACPDSSKLGTIRVDTPLLEQPMLGSVYLAKQNDNPFNSLLALYIVLEGTGQRVKLAGRVDPDPVTGQLTTTFRDNPQLPFERMRLTLKSGPRAPLVNPQTCGTYQSQTTITSWAGHSVSASTPMTVDEGCRVVGFAPSFEAGTVNPVGRRMSDFALSFGRGDHDQELRDIAVDMPEGLLAKIAGVGLCPDAAANAGTCGQGSRIGSVVAGAGPGPSPFYLPGRAYLTDGYKGGQYGLSVVVPAVAGPFDLGLVVVRAAIHVDRGDASVRVESDPLPRILQGIPTQIRTVDVSVDRPEFMLNPSSCEAQRISARIASQAGARADVGSRFQVGDCQALPFKPKLSLALTGKRQRTTGKHPGVKAVVRQSGVGEAGIEQAKVTLPKSVALDPDNAQALCEFADGTRPDLENHCPKGSIVGRAKAVTPLLDRPLTGNVYFVKNVRKDAKTGNAIRTLPMIVVALRGEIAINLRGVSSTTRGGKLVNTFASVPDAPITRFNLNIKGGSNGILAVTRTRKARINLCAKPNSHIAHNAMDGQNGKSAGYRVRVKTPCAKKRGRG